MLPGEISTHRRVNQISIISKIKSSVQIKLESLNQINQCQSEPSAITTLLQHIYHNEHKQKNPPSQHQQSLQLKISYSTEAQIKSRSFSFSEITKKKTKYMFLSKVERRSPLNIYVNVCVYEKPSSTHIGTTNKDLNFIYPQPTHNPYPQNP